MSLQRDDDVDMENPSTGCCCPPSREAKNKGRIIDQKVIISLFVVVVVVVVVVVLATADRQYEEQCRSDHVVRGIEEQKRCRLPMIADLSSDQQE